MGIRCTEVWILRLTMGFNYIGLKLKCVYNLLLYRNIDFIGTGEMHVVESLHNNKHCHRNHNNPGTEEQ